MQPRVHKIAGVAALATPKSVASQKRERTTMAILKNILGNSAKDRELSEEVRAAVAMRIVLPDNANQPIMYLRLQLDRRTLPVNSLE